MGLLDGLEIISNSIPKMTRPTHGMMPPVFQTVYLTVSTRAFKEGNAKATGLIPDSTTARYQRHGVLLQGRGQQREA